MQGFRRKLVFGVAVTLVIGALTGAWVLTRVITPFPDASEVLRLAATAGSNVTYTANTQTTTFHPRQAVRVNTRISHSPTAQRVDYIDGPMPGLVVITRGDETYMLKPGAQKVAVVVEAPDQAQRSTLDLMLKNHTAVVSGRSRVAGRSCYVVDVLPRAPTGPSKRLHIDRHKYVVLRTDDRMSDGTLKGFSRVTRIDFSAAVPDTLFMLPAGTRLSHPDGPKVVGLSEMSRELGFSVEPPRYMAEGYIEEAQRLYRCSCQCGHKSAHLSYTNGLSVVSIFQTSQLAHCGSDTCDIPADRDGCKVSESRQGRSVIIERPDKAIVVVGDLECSELKKIARSIP